MYNINNFIDSCGSKQKAIKCVEFETKIILNHISLLKTIRDVDEAAAHEKELMIDYEGFIRLQKSIIDA